MNKAIIFITGMSGARKSTILENSSNRGYNTIDTDYNQTSIEVFNQEQLEYDLIWDECKIKKIVDDHKKEILFISRTVSNQGKFYPNFYEIIYLSALLNIPLERFQNRSTNTYGKSDAERKEIINNFEQFGAIIEVSSTITIDTTRNISIIVDEIESLAKENQY